VIVGVRDEASEGCGGEVIAGSGCVVPSPRVGEGGGAGGALATAGRICVVEPSREGGGSERTVDRKSGAPFLSATTVASFAAAVIAGELGIVVITRFGVGAGAGAGRSSGGTSPPTFPPTPGIVCGGTAEGIGVSSYFFASAGSSSFFASAASSSFFASGVSCVVVGDGSRADSSSRRLAIGDSSAVDGGSGTGSSRFAAGVSRRVAGAEFAGASWSAAISASASPPASGLAPFSASA
jgi:hypothetical protein